MAIQRLFYDEKQIVRKAKKEIEAKLPEWGFGGKDIVETEIYYIENDEERQVFNYKQNEVWKNFPKPILVAVLL